MARGAALVDRMRPLAEKRGATVAQLALRWAIEQTGVTAVIAGSRNPAHAEANAAAGSLAVDASVLAEIDQT
jgi:aryl-alcohol dehydrogenase-like predicted oxidoreductase